MFLPACFVKMYYFAIEFLLALRYGITAQNVQDLLKKQPLALSRWPLAGKTKPKSRTLRQSVPRAWNPRQSGMTWDDVNKTHANLGSPREG
jgi:hypothetical protein